ncbi:MAG: hypothetical protein VB042_08540 [Victivallaceae bacterium]|nr:hypothetical protein [Victivallaceae bacterium]
MDSLVDLWWNTAMWCIFLPIPMYAIALFIAPKWADIPAFILPFAVAGLIYYFGEREAISWMAILTPVFCLLPLVNLSCGWKRQSGWRRLKNIAMVVLPLVFLFGVLSINYLGVP